MPGTLLRYNQLRGPYKLPVKYASKTNIDIASAPSSIGGGTPTNGDRIGLVGQTAPAENGIYVFSAAASPLTRALDANAVIEVPLGMYFNTTTGTNAGKFFFLSAANADPIVIDTSELTFTEMGTGQTRVANETPSGTVNGSNAAFTLANTPISGTVEVYVNGVLQDPGSGDDYQISGTTITFESGAIPQTGDSVRANYMR